jgi:hypothetical protein
MKVIYHYGSWPQDNYVATRPRHEGGVCESVFRDGTLGTDLCSRQHAVHVLRYQRAHGVKLRVEKKQ